MDTKLIPVLHKTREIKLPEQNYIIQQPIVETPQKYIVQAPIVPQNINEVQRQYSLEQSPYYNDMQYITYPEVVHGMYLITASGNIYNATNGAMLCPNITEHHRYKSVKLHVDPNGSKTFSVHRLVAYQFCNPPSDYATKVVNHIDSNHANNNANNLEWVTSAANNQHAIEVHSGKNTSVENNRPPVDEKFVRYLCQEFEKNKPNYEIMDELGMEKTAANYCLLSDIRHGNTWIKISSEYTFEKRSIPSAYNDKEKEIIEYFIYAGKTNKEIYSIMNNKDYIASRDQHDPRYRIMYSLRTSVYNKASKTKRAQSI